MLVPVKNWNPSTSRSVIPLSGISTKDASFYHRDTYSTMFIISLLMIARKCKQLDVSQQQEDNDNVVHLHNGVLLSCNNNKKNWHHEICRRMDRTRKNIILYKEMVGVQRSLCPQITRETRNIKHTEASSP